MKAKYYSISYTEIVLRKNWKINIKIEPLKKILIYF